MKRLQPWTLSLIVTVAAAAAACAPAAMAAPAGAPSHSHDEAHGAQMRLDHGRKWATDAPLREGMARIRALAESGLAAEHQGTMAAAEYAALAGRMETEVGKIVADCKLPPEADAVLHVLLSDLMGGAAAMAGRTPDATPQQGIVQVAAAVKDYGRYFEHPGWKPLRTPH